jgi:nicotinic acid phosphoribosyltransferase
MPKLVATHEVDDVAHWLASPKRAEVFAGVAKNIVTHVHPGDPNRVALTMEVADMAAFEAIMKSEAAAEAMKYDGVRPDTIVVYIEG